MNIKSQHVELTPKILPSQATLTMLDRGHLKMIFYRYYSN